MSSSESNLSEEIKYDFKNILADEKKELYNLKMRSETYDIDTDGDEFQQSQKNLPWEKEIENYYKQALNEKTDIIKEEIEKHGKFSIMQHEWELEKSKLRNTIDCRTSELSSCRSKVDTLISKLEEYDKLLKCNQSKNEETNCEVEKLHADVKTKEEELGELRVKFNEYKLENGRLIEEKTALIEQLNCAEKELNVQKLCAASMEESVKNNRSTLLEELKEKYEELSDIQTAYEEIKCQLDVEKEKVKDLVSTLVDENKSSENNNDCYINDQIPRFQAERITEENSCIICHLKKKIKVLQRDHGLPRSEFTDNQENYRFEQIILFTEKLKEFKRKCEPLGLFEEKNKNQSISITCCDTHITDSDQCCENTNAIVPNCDRKSEPNDSGDCYETKLKQLVCELDNLREEANLITKE